MNPIHNRKGPQPASRGERPQRTECARKGAERVWKSRAPRSGGNALSRQGKA
jgi:hypothetical protein